MTQRNWVAEVRAIVEKEVLCEFRSPHGVITAGLFALLSVVAISFASFNTHLAPTLASGLYWVVADLALVIGVPRSFLAEEENGTGDFVRMYGNPFSLYWGKQIFNLAVGLVTAIATYGGFIFFTNVAVVHAGFGWLSVLAGGLALNTTVTLCGAIGARASNRYTVTAVIALCLTIPIISWCVTSLRYAFGEGFPQSASQALLGVIAYGVVAMVIGPFLYCRIWRL